SRLLAPLRAPQYHFSCPTLAPYPVNTLPYPRIDISTTYPKKQVLQGSQRKKKTEQRRVVV
ncbi:MAG: hypothetical protein NUV65_03150, partial [Candidatus Roizmanbacteria bacterium]|nr:hypothetical protein [Candidatus Roizmanbacteria bacterium]